MTQSNQLSAYLNPAYAPELEYEVFSTHFGGVRLGILYVASAKERPVVSLKDDNKADIRESDIYYRYRAKIAVDTLPRVAASPA